jgi:hypothetical protein
LLYVILRIAPPLGRRVADAVPAASDWLAASAQSRGGQRPRRAGGAVGGQPLYLLSVCSLYLAIPPFTPRARLVALATARPCFTRLISLASGLNVRRQHAARASAMGLLGYLAPRWALALGLFLLILGSAGWLLEHQWLQAWLTLNVIVAFCHYAYDGMIWGRQAVPAAGGSYAAA